jgi:hypothetical protein
MSTAAVSSNSLYQELQTYFHQRSSDLQQLGQSLQSGDLAGAQKEYQTLQALGQSGPFANGGAFRGSQRQQDLAAVGQALQSGDLAGAQQAFSQLESTFNQHQRTTDPRPSSAAPPAIVLNLSAASPSTPVNSSNTALPSSAASPSASTGGPEIVLNLGAVTPGEQITIGVSSSSNGAEQVTIGVAGQPNQQPEQITLNLNQGSNQKGVNQQIILNLFNSTSSTPQSSGLSLTA